MRFLLSLVLLVVLLGCGLGHKPPDPAFVVTVHDDLGLGASFQFVAYYPDNHVEILNATLPPGGDVKVVVGAPPQTLSVFGAQWSAGYTPQGYPAFAQAESWTSQQFGPWCVWSVLYPSGVASGSIAR